MSNRVEQALREYQDAVARYKNLEAQNDVLRRTGREKRTSGALVRLNGAWSAYLEAWAEEGTGAWFAPFIGGTHV